MKKTFLALSFLALALLCALMVGASLGAAQTSQPVKDARPTPTPDRILPPAEPPPEDLLSPEIPPLPDLVVEQIRTIPTAPMIGEAVRIEVTIANRGLVNVEVGNNFWSDLYIDPAVVPIQLGQNGQVEWPCQYWWVPAGGSRVLETTWVFDEVKTYALYAQVDTDGHVAEANENNNVTGPVHIEVRAPNRIVHQTHQDFQLGLASSLDISHPEGVIRRGIFVEPSTEPEVYEPDVQIDDPPLPPSGPTNVNQVKPALASNGNGVLYAAWEDGRNGGVFNRDIYSSRSPDGGATWGPDIRINDDPGLPNTANQVSPDLVYDSVRDRLYAVWQDGRNGDYDIYFAYSVDGGDNWVEHSLPLNDDTGTANQLNPSIAVGPDTSGVADWVYVVWQDQRNGNDDVYLARSDDGGLTWDDPNYFVTDDPHMTWQNQSAPSVAVDNLFGIVVVAWEDWRDPVHPEVYAMWSWDEGETFGIDVPVTIVAPEQRKTYRVEPALAAHSTVEIVEYWDETLEMTMTKSVYVTAIHVAWQDGQGDGADAYYAYAAYNHDVEARIPCPYPYQNDFCFAAPQEVSGFVIDSAYVRPPDEAPAWSIEPSWQGQVSLDLIPDEASWNWTFCHADSTEIYSKGVVIAWSDARSYDDWRYEIRTRRVASPEGDPTVYEVCEDWAVGMVNGNPKIYAYRDDFYQYEIFKPAAVRQQNPYIRVDKQGIWVAWDDDRYDEPVEPNSVRDRDVFSARMITPGLAQAPEGIYISPVFDSLVESPAWYVLSWWGATQHAGDLLMQTRFGTTPFPPQDDVATSGWTRWTGNPSSPILGCPGEGCHYDAPGRRIVRPDGTDWLDDPDHPDQYRYIQYKAILRGYGRLTALSQVVIHYKGPNRVYVPVVHKNY